MKNKLLDIYTPAAIERESFAIIERELTDLLSSGAISAGSMFFPPLGGPCWEVARRIIHTTADYSILPSLHIPEAAVEAGVNALLRGAHIYTDTEMARNGMPVRRLNPLGVQATCMHKLPGVDQYAAEHNCTKARAGIMLAAGMAEAGAAPESAKGLADSILAIGNAPTAILALLDYLDAGGQPPALVIAMPVGFVNAAESKELLLERDLTSCICLRGRRGGSPLVAATVNALAELALRRQAG